MIDPTKPMTRQQQIEFIKQQTRLAKKIAIRPHIAESEVLAALHDLEQGKLFFRPDVRISVGEVFTWRDRSIAETGNFRLKIDRLSIKS